ncbi:PEP-CTERM sorting domain-containing protein, partial [Aerosakkonema funiforme]
PPAPPAEPPAPPAEPPAPPAEPPAPPVEQPGVKSVPEPGTVGALLLTGLAALGLGKKRNENQ